jgi:hypothetical protein
VNVQPLSIDQWAGDDKWRSNYQKPQPITPQSLVVGAAKDLGTLAAAGPQTIANLPASITHNQRLAYPLGKPDPQRVASAGVNVGTGMLLGGLEGEGISPTPELNRLANGTPKAPVSVPTTEPMSMMSKVMREVPGIGGYLRKMDLVNSILGNKAEAPSPSIEPVPETNGVPWGSGGQGPLDLRGKMIPPEPTPPSVPQRLDPASFGVDQLAQAQAKQELGSATHPNFLKLAQEIKTQMLSQQPQVVNLKVPPPKAPVDPYAGNTPTMEPAQSTTILQHGYDQNSQTMTVHFKNGNVYSYKGVPPEVYKAYQGSESQGSFFANNIKGRYSTSLRGTVKPTAGQTVRKTLGGQ